MMRATYLLTLSLLLWLGAQAQGFDSTLAKQYGADEYGMKMYVLVILKTGSSTLQDKDSISALFSGHMANIGRLADAGQLVVAGPFGKNDKDFRGIFILDVKTTDEARALLQTDPAIAAHLLEPELLPWYGSAALPAYLPVHKKIAKSSP